MKKRATNPSSRPPQGGFTIVEVLIAVAVMSLMLVSILKVLSAVRLTRDRIHNTQETQLAGPIIMDLIWEDLRGVHVLGRAKPEHLKVTDRVQYGLDADRVDFITTTSSREPIWIDGEVRRAQVCEVSYVTRPNPEDDEFLELYRREDYGVDDEPFTGGQYTFLTNRVKSFSIEVFTEDDPDAEPLFDWGNPDSSDEETQGLPASIVISMTLENAPRLLQEQLEFSSTQLMTVTYKRTIRFSEELRKNEDELAYLSVPRVPADNGGPDAAGEDDKDDEIEVGGPANGGGNRNNSGGQRGSGTVERNADGTVTARGGGFRGDGGASNKDN